MIPSTFKIANQVIKIIIEESLPDNNYGYFCDASNTIKLSKSISVEGEGVIQLSEEQLENTLWHEIFHVFQFYYNNKYDESQAQVFVNFMREFQNSKQ